MDLHLYPMDTQYCPLIIESCKYSTAQQPKTRFFLLTNHIIRSNFGTHATSCMLVRLPEPFLSLWQLLYVEICPTVLLIRIESVQINWTVPKSTVILFTFFLFRLILDAYTTADVDYRWKGGDKQSVEIVSKEMAQFDLTDVKTYTKSQTNSKGEF